MNNDGTQIINNIIIAFIFLIFYSSGFTIWKGYSKVCPPEQEIIHHFCFQAEI